MKTKTICYDPYEDNFEFEKEISLHLNQGWKIKDKFCTFGDPKICFQLEIEEGKFLKIEEKDVS